MAYDKKVMQVLRKFRLVDDNGQPVQVNLKELGPGPKLDQDVIDRFVAADTTPDKVWLDWIFHQAAGGEPALEESANTLEQMRGRFTNERTAGFVDKDGDRHAPVSPEQAEVRWQRVRPNFERIAFYASEDLVRKLGVYGFFRSWPGGSANRSYENVVKTITNYLKLFPKLLQMNRDLEHEGKPPLATSPDSIKTLAEMDQISIKVERYFASKAARDDIRLASWKKEDWIYNDDYLTAIAPLTYGTAVKYGWDAWPFANRDKFDRVLSGESCGWEDEWKKLIGNGNFFVYIRFNQPVPRWVSRSGGKFQVLQLTHLALQISEDSRLDPDSIVVYDEEGRNTMRIGDVKRMILEEPGREDEPADAEMPIKRGPNVYKSDKEAQEMVKHLDACMEEIVAWAAKFDTKKVKSDVMKLG